MRNTLTADLDRIQQEILDSASIDASDHPQQLSLQGAVRAFDTPPKLRNLAKILEKHEFSDVLHTEQQAPGAAVEWLVLARATVVVYEGFLEELFQRALPLSEDNIYWDQVLRHRGWLGLYLLQTLPQRLWAFSRLLATQAKQQIDATDFTLGTLRNSVSDRTLFRRIAFPHIQGQKAAMANKFISLDTMVKQEVMAKRKGLRGLQGVQARAVGMLATEAKFENADTLQQDVIGLASMLESLSDELCSDPEDLEKSEILDATAVHASASPAGVAQTLIALSTDKIADSRAFYRASASIHSKPSVLTRYWPVGVGLYFSGSTILKFISNRQQAIEEWIRETLETAKSFWQNWVIEPISKIIATIRHDEGSEVALMSRRSLAADMDSLERMVVDFAVDNPEFASTTDLDALKSAAREGDVTPVLIAYEKNIKSPLKNAVTGSLIRSLLIQVQKTKVDVEVAINGIDKLLKSQELVFGFLGVSPALVLLWAGGSWCRRTLGLKKHKMGSTSKIETVKVLRTIERLLTTQREGGKLSYKRRGLILCEVQVLRKYAKRVPSSLRHEFLQDLSDVEEATALKTDAVRQVIARIYRVYTTAHIL
ncbi:ATP synthase regulation protein NCA2-domain-containing protein [Protomyces lactucae-debilis]|uniref:ATP synthase regulation protein NCA2-domain-containing protein n=1 Tax=Protomyces lactucae-debilis TaxID=2754530 RepID=A0A1Y2FRZ4_PROLT|nr:ATP synthase regulation protein NCA2-domain-containing protein [Protomyces lactucae-debilis]ORY86781.1 ATP synthase regulation protein NCA2-domain-containing protein [Protomyces lactucae-debilis]